jgi:hypothetical protein
VNKFFALAPNVQRALNKLKIDLAGEDSVQIVLASALEKGEWYLSIRAVSFKEILDGPRYGFFKMGELISTEESILGAYVHGWMIGDDSYIRNTDNLVALYFDKVLFYTVNRDLYPILESLLKEKQQTH